MHKPLYPKAFSKRYKHDYRRDKIIAFKSEAHEVVSVLEEYAAKKAELANDTPFNDFETNLGLELINKQLMELYELIQNNPYVSINKYSTTPKLQ